MHIHKVTHQHIASKTGNKNGNQKENKVRVISSV